MSTKVFVLYRMFDAQDNLLYVGITNNPPSRFSGHRNAQRWWGQVATIRLATYPSRDALRTAEREAIIAEEPLYNRTHAFRDDEDYPWDDELEAALHHAAVAQATGEASGGELGTLFRRDLSSRSRRLA